MDATSLPLALLAAEVKALRERLAAAEGRLATVEYLLGGDERPNEHDGTVKGTASE
jgi:hypothetical protein